ncbi:MAG: GNAT family protein [bacterium]|nr:GNAT family protein [bacterium]
MLNKKIKLIKGTKTTFKIIMGPFQNVYQKSYRKLLKEHRGNNRIQYFFVKDINNEVIGYMYYRYEKRFNAFEIGGAIIPDKRSRGYGYMAHRILIDFLFRKKKAQRIQAIVSVKNLSEIKILKRCSFDFEGKLKKAGRVGSKMYDLAIFGILKN